MDGQTVREQECRRNEESEDIESESESAMMDDRRRDMHSEQFAIGVAEKSKHYDRSE